MPAAPATTAPPQRRGCRPRGPAPYWNTGRRTQDLSLEAGLWAGGVPEWMDRAACAEPGVDPNWFTVDEVSRESSDRTARAHADECIARAQAVCRRCPVRTLCRIHAE